MHYNLDLNYIITLLLLPVLILHRGHAHHHQRAGGDVQGRDEDEGQRGDLATLGATHVRREEEPGQAGEASGPAVVAAIGSPLLDNGVEKAV